MRWEITTKDKVHVISATSSSVALAKVQSKDRSELVSVKLLPKNAVDNIKSKWRSWFGK